MCCAGRGSLPVAAIACCRHPPPVSTQLPCDASHALFTLQSLFRDEERQGVRLRVTAASKAADAAAAAGFGGQPLHEEYLDKCAFEERLALASANDNSADPDAVASSTQTMKQRYSALKPFIIISASYLLFTITDGAVRMVVLLHAYQMGFSAMEVAIMFSFYEVGCWAAGQRCCMQQHDVYSTAGMSWQAQARFQHRTLLADSNVHLKRLQAAVCQLDLCSDCFLRAAGWSRDKPGSWTHGRQVGHQVHSSVWALHATRGNRHAVWLAGAYVQGICLLAAALAAHDQKCS